MRIAADGYIDVSDGRRVRTPGNHNSDVEPVPEAQALSFLLSHAFPGHRRIVRTLTLAERKKIRMALWADSVAKRMSIVDRIWRGEGKAADIDLLDSVADAIGGAGAGKTICFLADSAVMPTKSFLKHFRDDFVAAVENGGSPVFKASKQVGAGT